MFLCFHVLEPNIEIHNHLISIQKRIEDFKGGVWSERKFHHSRTGYYLLKVVPVYPHFYLAGFGVALSALLFDWSWWFIGIGLVLGLTGIIYHPVFYLWMFRLSLRKAGIKARLKRVSCLKYLEVVLWGK